MSESLNINRFGTLTIPNGQKLSYKDFDLNSDGKVTQQEYESVLNDLKLDMVELSEIDKDDDKIVSEDEFKLWDQKIEMQKSVNEKLAEVARDVEIFKSASEIREVLRDYIDVFTDSYIGKTENLAEEFTEALDKKYELVRNNIIAGKPADADEEDVIIVPKLSDIEGSKYRVSTENLDLSMIEGYDDNQKFTTKGKKNHEEDIRTQAYEAISKSSLKAQLKDEIWEMLEQNGLTFSQVSTVFENIYSKSLNEALDEISSHKTNHRVMNKKKKYESDQGLKEIVNNFIVKFNNNIEAEINKMNASDEDIDLMTIDFSVVGKDSKGNGVKDSATGTDLSDLYESGKLLTVSKKGALYYKELAKEMIVKLKPQMMQKAKDACAANGVKFDITKFDEIFNKAQDNAVNQGVYGITAKRTAVGGGVTSAALGVGIAVGTPFIALMTQAAFVPYVGWGVAAALGIAAAAIMLFSGRHSESTLDTRTLVDTFAESFKQDYEAWLKNAPKEEVSTNNQNLA